MKNWLWMLQIRQKCFISIKLHNFKCHNEYDQSKPSTIIFFLAIHIYFNMKMTETSIFYQENFIAQHLCSMVRTYLFAHSVPRGPYIICHVIYLSVSASRFDVNRSVISYYGLVITAIKIMRRLGVLWRNCIFSGFFKE